MRSAKDLRKVIQALGESPEFLAGWLAYTPGGHTWVSRRLNLDQASLERLLLCRSPRPSSFPTDVKRVAALVEVGPESLAATLREAAALTTLFHAGHVGAEIGEPAAAPSLLAAARDATEETISRGTGSETYIRKLADDIRARAPEEAKAIHDVDSLVAWAVPLAIVVLPELSLDSAHGWLRERGVALGFGDRDRPLRGLLLAWRGNGLIFVDGSLPLAERRFTVAHELGHFLLDYLEPRHRTLRRAPDLLEVLDGYRGPTKRDRARAVLELVPLGVHTHLLDRDPHGAAAWDAELGEDLSSRFALELLSPWSEVRAILGQLPGDLPWPARLEEAARLLEMNFLLPEDAARTRARVGLESIGRGPDFLER